MGPQKCNHIKNEAWKRAFSNLESTFKLRWGKGFKNCPEINFIVKWLGSTLVCFEELSFFLYRQPGVKRENINKYLLIVHKMCYAKGSGLIEDI